MYITGYFREDIFTRWTIQPTSLRESCSHNTEMNEQVHTQRETHMRITWNCGSQTWSPEEYKCASKSLPMNDFTWTKSTLL